MTYSIQIFLTTIFWLNIVGLVLRSAWLISDHPRQQKPVNIGTDVFGLIFTIVMLAWVSVLRFGT